MQWVKTTRLVLQTNPGNNRTEETSRHMYKKMVHRSHAKASVLEYLSPVEALDQCLCLSPLLGGVLVLPGEDLGSQL